MRRHHGEAARHRDERVPEHQPRGAEAPLEQPSHRRNVRGSPGHEDAGNAVGGHRGLRQRGIERRLDAGNVVRDPALEIAAADGCGNRPGAELEGEARLLLLRERDLGAKA